MQSALETVVAGNNIYVARGTYKPDKNTGDRNSTFTIPTDVKVYGHFAGTEGMPYERQMDQSGNETILSGEIGDAGQVSDNSYHVVRFNGVSSSTFLDGFTVSDGNADGSGTENAGGGILNISSSNPTILNCLIKNNSAQNGAGMANSGYSSPAISNCNFMSNSSNNGGGVYNHDHSSPRVVNSFISGNSAGYGGGVYNTDSSSPVLINCVIMGNMADYGGAMAGFTSSAAEIINCSLAGNNASDTGGALYNSDASPLLKNTIIWGNNTSSGLITNEGTASPTFYNCDIETCGGSSAWDASYGTDGGNNMDSDPRFEDLRSFASAPFIEGYLHLYTGSPCSNTGNNSYVPADITTDIHAAARIQNTTVDMGAYEGVEMRGIIYVKSDAAGLNNGRSWNNAFIKLQSALKVAISGDLIYVAAGTYKPAVSSRDSSFVVVDGVSMYGHFAGTETSHTGRLMTDTSFETILSGDIGTPTLTTDNSYHVVKFSYLHTTPTFDGFTIQNGNADGSSENGFGGGIYVNGSGTSNYTNLNIYNCIIRDNNASSGGGGVYYNLNHGTCYGTLTKSVITGNTSNGRGGGVYVNCEPGGYSSSWINECTVTTNSAQYGGGIYVNAYNGGRASFNIANTLLNGNTASSGGGGYYYNGGLYVQQHPGMFNCTINGNRVTSGNGGGIYIDGGYHQAVSPNFVNCTLSGNEISTGYKGDALYCFRFASPLFKNSVLWGNSTIGGPVYRYTDYGPASPNPTFYYCDIQSSGGSSAWNTGFGTDGGNNLDMDPVFVVMPDFNTAPTTSGDCRLADTSPCKDAGLNSYNGLSTDLDNTARVKNTTIDMGPYESSTPRICAQPLTGGIVSASPTTVCYGTSGITFTSESLPTSYTGIPEYQWQYTTIASPTFSDWINTGTNSTVYTHSETVTQTTSFRRLSRVTCDPVDWSSAVSSNIISLNIYSPFSAGEILTTGETICYNGDPGTIGSFADATGGNLPVTYKWQSSASGDFSDAVNLPSGSSATYNPETLTSTTSFRRMAKDATCTPDFIASTGTWVVTVQQLFISGTIQTTGETICYGGDPGIIGSVTDAGGGNNSITYKWESSTDGFITSGTTIAGATSATFNPPAGLTATTSYRRYAKDGSCNTSFTASSGTWVVTVLPQFTAGAIQTAGETLCYGGNPAVIGSVTDAGGGDISITYKWESSTNGFTTSGTTITGATSSTYDPPAGLTSVTSYRRYAKDGTCNVSFTVSTGTWLVTVRPQFSAGTIQTTGESLCYGGDPGIIESVTDAGGGDNNITYKWESSTDGFTTFGTTITGATASSFNPPSGLTVTTSYRRYTREGTCNTTFTASAGSWVVTVRPPFTEGTIQTTGETVCYEGDPGLIGSVTDASGGNNSITYKWESSTDGFTTTGTTITGATSSSYNPPPGLTTTTSYRRYARDGACNTAFIASSGTWVVTVHLQFNSGAVQTAGQTIGFGGDPSEIGSATDASGGDNSITYQWESSTDGFTTTHTLIEGANQSSFDPPAGLTVNTSFRRYAKDGTCSADFSQSEGTWVVNVCSQFTPGEIADEGETICYNGNPGEIGNVMSAGGGDGNIDYKWESSTDGFITSGTVIDGATSSIYDPPGGLTVTTNYRRFAKDHTYNTTFEVSTGTWVVTVRPQFTAGTVQSAGETICTAGDPSEIGSVTNASGGDNSITYKWESSTEGFTTSGTTITGATSSFYNPPPGLTTTTSYRRYARDGACNTAFTPSSGTWLVTVYPPFTAGAIRTTGETICYGGNPATITSSVPGSGGDGSIAYRWESSTDGFTSTETVIDPATSANYDPPAGLTLTTWYRRQVREGTCNTNWTSSEGIWKVMVINDPPVISGCPDNITVYTNSSNPSSCAQSISWTEPTASDNCDGSLTFFSRDHAPGSSFPEGTTPVNYVFKDNQGNAATCTFSVTVIDNTPPVISGCPNNITAYSQNGDPSKCAQAVTWAEPTASDKCDGNLSYFSRNYGPGTLFPEGTTQVIYVFKDNEGNTATCTFSVTVIDNTPPVISGTPANITVYSNDYDPLTCSQLVSWTQPTAVDNCESSLSFFSRSHAPGASFNLGMTTVTYQFKDNEGNTSSCSFTVKVVDNTPPAAKCKNVTVVLDDSGNGTTTASAVNNESADACGIQGLNLDKSAFTCSNLGPNTVILTVTDVNGNSSSCTATVSVVDNIPPQITCKPSGQRFADPYKTYYTVSGTEFDASATDNCSVTSMKYSINGGPWSTNGASLSGIHLNLGSNTITWSAGDISSNTSTCSTVVTVQKRTTTLVYNGDLTEQYSDVTNLSATLRDISGGLPGAGVSGKTILFTIGSQSVSAVTGAGGTVSATLKITQLPGNYSVVTTFAEDDTYLGSNDSDPFVIQAETACGLYTGPVYTNTSGPATLTASITLSVIVSQEADGNVTNLNYPSNLGFSFNVSSDANGSVSLVGSPVFNASTSTFSQEAMVTIKTGNIFTSLDVSWTIGKGFTNVSCMDQQWILTVAVPSTDYAAGGGHIVLGDNSQGTQKGLKGTKNNFGFGIKWGKNFSKLTGNFNTIWRQADKSFQARSNTASALVITKLGTNQYKAQITYTNVNIRQLDCLTNCWSDGNGTAILTVYDYCEGSNCTSVNMDKIGIAIRNKTGTLVYSSNTFDPATTDKTTVQSLAGGNIQVKPASIKSAMTEMVQTDAYEPHMLVYPNPFSDKLKFEFTSPTDANARIELFDLTGRLVATVFNNPVKAENTYYAEFIPANVISSVYMYRMTLGDKVMFGKVIYKK